MQWESSRSRRRVSNRSHASNNHTGLPPVTVQHGIISEDKIFSLESKSGLRNGQKTKGKGKGKYEALMQSFTDLKVEYLNLENEKNKLEVALLKGEEKYARLEEDFNELRQRYSELEHLEQWGKIIREKTMEIHRLQEVIKKMQTDRTEALNEKITAVVAIDNLRSKLRKRRKEVSDIRAIEKTQTKARVLGETEGLRREREIALAQLAQSEMMVGRLRAEIRDHKRLSEEKTRTMKELEKRHINKERQMDDTRKNLVIAKMKMATQKLLH